MSAYIETLRESLRGFAERRWQLLLSQFEDLDALRQRLDYQTYSLAFIALVAALLLGFGQLATQGSIATRQEEDMQATLAQVLPKELYDNEPLREVKAIAGEKVYIARQQGAATAVAFQFTANGGYSGPILLMLGVDKDGTVLGVRVIAHAETPGLGDKIERGKSDWILSFARRSLEGTRWKVKKDGGDFDQFAGATITPRAVVRGVESGLKFFREHKDELLK